MLKSQLKRAAQTPQTQKVPIRCPHQNQHVPSLRKLHQLLVFPCCIVWPCLCSIVELATIFLSSGFAGLQTCFSAACSVSSATSLGLRIFRNTPTLLNQAEYRSMTTEAPWALRPQKFLPVTVTAQGLSLELIDTEDRETARKNWHGAKLPCLDVLDLLEYYANLGLPSFPILVLSQH